MVALLCPQAQWASTQLQVRFKSHSSQAPQNPGMTRSVPKCLINLLGVLLRSAIPSQFRFENLSNFLVAIKPAQGQTRVPMLLATSIHASSWVVTSAAK
jgi:hypothetical protein